MARIERRQSRIRSIHERNRTLGTSVKESVPRTMGVHHVIGDSQNHPENITMFLRKHAGDPAVKVNICICGHKSECADSVS